MAQYQATDSIHYLIQAEKCYDQIRQLSLWNISEFYEPKNKLQKYQIMVDNNSNSIEILNQLYETTKEERYLHKMLDVSQINKNPPPPPPPLSLFLGGGGGGGGSLSLSLSLFLSLILH